MEDCKVEIGCDDLILTAHQPAYLPWLGYFEKIAKSDVFIYLDTVQFEKNSFTNRNRIKTPQGVTWLTVPVQMKGHLGKKMLDIEIDNRQPWKKKHLNAVYLNYKKVANFEEKYHKIENIYQSDYKFLNDLCWEHLLFWLKELHIQTQVVKQSELSIESKKSDLVFDLCKHLNVSTYISGALGKDYLEENKFTERGIQIIYQDYQYPMYPQLWEEFIPNLSVLDFWMNTDGDITIMTLGEDHIY